DSVVIRTGAGLKTCNLTARHGNSFEFRSSMGVPGVGDEFAITLTGGEISGVPVSMGNPHFVVFVSEFEVGWQAVAQPISMHPDFKHGMNVELVKVLNRSEIEVRFWERGAGDTVGIVAPAGPIEPDALEAGCAALLRLGYQPFYLPSILDRELYFAGSLE